jgi:hypothetical protein
MKFVLQRTLASIVAPRRPPHPSDDVDRETTSIAKARLGLAIFLPVLIVSANIPRMFSSASSRSHCCAASVESLVRSISHLMSRSCPPTEKDIWLRIPFTTQKPQSKLE